MKRKCSCCGYVFINKNRVNICNFVLEHDKYNQMRGFCMMMNDYINWSNLNSKIIYILLYIVCP